MKTGAQIVAELESEHAQSALPNIVCRHWPTIRAALLAYEPKSALRTILDRVERNGHSLPGEIEAARAELDALEKR